MVFAESHQLLVQKSSDKYVARQAHKWFVALMRASGLPEADCLAVDGCHSSLWRELICPEAERHYERKRMVVAVGCHNRYCCVCTNSRVLREVRVILYNVKRWYDSMGVSPLFFDAEVTLPADLRAKVNESNIDALSMEFYAALCEALAGFPADASAKNAKRDSEFVLGCYINFQNWSSGNPLFGGQNPHWHATILSIVFDKADVPFLLFNGGCWISPAQLQKFKEAWTRRASKLLGNSSYRETFVTHWHYSSSLGQGRKRLAYQMRYASMDVNKICKDGFYWSPITKLQAERLKVRNRGLNVNDPDFSAIGFKKNRYYLRVQLVLSKVDKLEFLRLIERPKKRKYVRPYGWLASRAIKKAEKAFGLVPIKKSVIVKELSRMYCSANVKKAGKKGLFPCGCILERSDNVFDWARVKEIGAVVLVREKQSFAVLKAWDDSPLGR
ncbi:MAG: hypothetical protein ACYCPW_02220 [Nitrososphaerales archaeon]